MKKFVLLVMIGLGLAAGLAASLCPTDLGGGGQAGWPEETSMRMR